MLSPCLTDQLNHKAAKNHDNTLTTVRNHEFLGAPMTLFHIDCVFDDAFAFAFVFLFEFPHLPV